MKKHLHNNDQYKLYCFLVGNGMSPEYAMRVMLSDRLDERGDLTYDERTVDKDDLYQINYMRKKYRNNKLFNGKTRLMDMTTGKVERF